MVYLRITENDFGFYTDEVHEIKESDISISQEDYEEFFKLQSCGTHFKLKADISKAKTLFEFVDTYKPTVIPQEVTPTESFDDEINKLKQMINLLQQKIENR